MGVCSDWQMSGVVRRPGASSDGVLDPLRAVHADQVELYAPFTMSRYQIDRQAAVRQAGGQVDS